jgi:hypothetical protein
MELLVRWVARRNCRYSTNERLRGKPSRQEYESFMANMQVVEGSVNCVGREYARFNDKLCDLMYLPLTTFIVTSFAHT